MGVTRLYVINCEILTTSLLPVWCLPWRWHCFLRASQQLKTPRNVAAYWQNVLEIETSFRRQRQRLKLTTRWIFRSNFKLKPWKINFNNRLQEEEYVEGGEVAVENEEQAVDEESANSSTTTTTESTKKIGPSVRPFRSNQDLLSTLKKRRLNEKNSKPAGKTVVDWHTLQCFRQLYGWPKPCLLVARTLGVNETDHLRVIAKFHHFQFRLNYQLNSDAADCHLNHLDANSWLKFDSENGFFCWLRNEWDYASRTISYRTRNVSGWKWLSISVRSDVNLHKLFVKTLTYCLHFVNFNQEKKKFNFWQKSEF